MTGSNATETKQSKTANTQTQEGEREEYLIQSDEAVTEAVVRAVRTERETDQSKLEPLFSRIDTEALNSLFRSSTDTGVTHTSGTVSFDYEGYHITTDGTETITLSEKASRANVSN